MMRLFPLFIAQLLTVQAIWPQPKTIEQGNTPIILSKDFKIIPSKRLINQFNLSKDLKLAINKTLEFIRNDHHRPLKIDRDESVKKIIKKDYQIVLDTLELRITYSKSNNWLMNSFKNYYWSWKNDDEMINLNEIKDEIRKPLNDRDESYEIQIGKDQFETRDCVTFHGFIEASNALGLLRGLQTFSQLVYATNITTNHQEVNKVVNQEETPKENVDEEQKSEENEKEEEGEEEVNTFQYLYGPITIKDSPSFPYRGILLDTSRNYYPIPDLLRTIEVMSWSKLSTFHWHIVDAQSWPLEIPHLPDLSKKGAYSNKEIYTINDVKNVIEFANSLGIDVMIEIDSPGHTSIIGESFVDLIACKDFQPWNLFAAEPPAGQLRIADENALELIESIYGFVCDQFPGTLFSSGGDEVYIQYLKLIQNQMT
ncbi:hypothetical protein CROQUDRAFT_134216 [Cronartium quercuum f. sp. fusiforme G11]|uniref:beta-N-acetylhexosaminidase n=1 Tax=Cronartium quercuum f. sp. fusiforme G11 TaxID=708437 RepID=A0A9P6TA19_9BASI|nr:hypothetical protein CROQUDRAFT_134216 [Cronartium quercuum f. sp. fusiforme G11]